MLRTCLDVYICPPILLFWLEEKEYHSNVKVPATMVVTNIPRGDILPFQMTSFQVPRGYGAVIRKS
jgi:hypothetical protein